MEYRLLKKDVMKIDNRPAYTPWKSGMATDEQIQAYKKAIGPLQHDYFTVKATRLNLFKSIKPSPAPERN